MPDTSPNPRNAGMPALGAEFLAWYYLQYPLLVIRTYGRYARAFGGALSFLFLLKTLLSPWKSIKDDYPSKGFDPRRILETLFLNLTARGVGAVLRLGTIVVGVMFEVALLCVFCMYLIVWLLFPFIVIFSLAHFAIFS